MNQQEFMSMNEVERVKSINQMLRGVEKIADVASMIGMNSSTLSKKLTEGGAYIYSRSLKQYVLRDEKQDGVSKEDVMKYLQENIVPLKALVERETRSDTALALLPEVLSKGEYVVKNTRIPTAINDHFAQLCEDKYSYLRLQDLLAQALMEFVIKYR